MVKALLIASLLAISTPARADEAVHPAPAKAAEEHAESHAKAAEEKPHADPHAKAAEEKPHAEIGRAHV